MKPVTFQLAGQNSILSATPARAETYITSLTNATPIHSIKFLKRAVAIVNDNRNKTSEVVENVVEKFS